MNVLRLRILDQPIDFVDCGEIAVGFRSILKGWDVQEIPVDAGAPAYLTFSRRDYGYHWDSPWIADPSKRVEDPSVTMMDAVFDFHYEFIDWFVDINPDHFCLHAAAATGFGGGAVLFPCVQRAGKSTLSVQLAMEGHRLLGDDVVVLSPDGDRAQSMGLLPRLRLPLPASVITDQFRTFVAEHAGLSDRRWQYVDLPDGQIAPLGESSAVRGVVLLERGVSEAKFGPLSKSQALKALIDQNFGMLRNPDAIFDRLHRLVMQCECMILRYSRPADAVRLLEAHFGP